MLCVSMEADLAIVASMQNAYSIYEHGVHNNCEARLCTLSNFPSKCIEVVQTLFPLAF